MAKKSTRKRSKAKRRPARSKEAEAHEAMDVLARLAATPLEVTFEGKEYKLRPLTISQYADLKQWIKRRIAEDANETQQMLAEAGAPESAVADLWLITVRQMGDPLNSLFFSTQDGNRRLMLESLRVNHPEVDEEFVERMMQDPAVVRDVMLKIRLLHAVDMDIAGN